MSQFPYANFGTELIEPVPQRTSVLAILSLVIAIVSIVPLFCVFPGSGALAVMFGGAALLFINRERGRLSGTGLAATGIVLGLMVTVLQIVVVMMASRAMQVVKRDVVGPFDKALVALDTGDYKTARTMFLPSADAKITDEMLAQFVKTYQSQIGVYKGFPDSLIGAVRTYVEVGPGMQGLQGRNDVIPFPVNFAKGPAVIGIMIDPSQNQGNSGPGVNFPVINMGILTPDQKAFWLIDPKTIPMKSGGVRIGPRSNGGLRVDPQPEDDTATSPLPPAPPEPEKPDSKP